MREVNSIDASLDENNYQQFQVPIVTKEITGRIPNKDRKGNTTIEFSNQPPNKAGRQKNVDIIKNKPGVANAAKNALTPIDTFKLFITDEMINNIVENTNRKIEEAMNRLENTDKYPYKSYVKIIDDVDLRAFIGIMYLRGLYGLNRHNTRVLFSDRHGMPVFGATMSRLRFEFILKYLSLDDDTTREDRWQQDRFAAMREFFEECNRNFGKIDDSRRLLIP